MMMMMIFIGTLFCNLHRDANGLYLQRRSLASCLFVHTAAIDRRILEGFEETLWEQLAAYAYHVQTTAMVQDVRQPTQDLEVSALGAPLRAVNVRITKDAVDKRHVLTATRQDEDATETLVHYGTDYKQIVGVCQRCACSKYTPECRRNTGFD